MRVVLAERSVSRVLRLIGRLRNLVVSLSLLVLGVNSLCGIIPLLGDSAHGLRHNGADTQISFKGAVVVIFVDTRVLKLGV